MVAHFPETFGLPEILDVQCKSKGSGPVACRLLLSSDNAALILMQQGKWNTRFSKSTRNDSMVRSISGKTKWVREEALANIVAIEMIDLPLADFEGSIESELQNKDGKLIELYLIHESKLNKNLFHLIYMKYSKRKVTSIVSLV